MSRHLALAAAGTIVLTLATAAAARPGGWNNPGWGRPSASDWANSRWDRPSSRNDDDREGKVEVESFVAEGAAAQALGKGSVAVTIAEENAAYEAAVIDQLVKAGYDTLPAPEGATQIAELRIVRNELVPAEGKRKPVSGEMDLGISNYGTSVGMGIHIDLTKPKKALVSTRLETRIRDAATGDVLWEGRADIATREGDGDWSEQDIAARLAQSLFRKFPGATS